MQTIRQGNKGEIVETLQNLLSSKGYEIIADGIFGNDTYTVVRSFQKDHNLIADGIVGRQTWHLLLDKEDVATDAFRLTEADYFYAAKILVVDVAAIKAVLEVETGNKGGFIAKGKPTMLFEGHIFWTQLKQRGIDPLKHQRGNEDILYSKWTKAHYKGRIKEYDRLERARAIHREAADSSASWGLAQIMGFNYRACGCKSVSEFVQQMHQSAGKQLELFVHFIRSNHWDDYLRSHNWKEFARHYNGAGYTQNQYDKRLASAYDKYKKSLMPCDRQ